MAAERYAVVTGGNKGIGYEICKQLASHGITVVLTARDEKRGAEALAKLKAESGLSDHLLLFHQLDVVDSSSVAALAQFIKTRFGRLDILVNNAGVIAIGDLNAYKEALANLDSWGKLSESKWSEALKETYEEAVQGLETNYYGAKRMIEVFIPLLQLSKSPRIVNVSSSMGKLKYIPSERTKGVLGDVENLTEEGIDVLLHEYLNDFKRGLIDEKGWPAYFSAYIVSKAALNAYTRILAKKYPSLCINALCPGYVRTDINFNTGIFTPAEGAESAVRLALLPDGSPSGLFYFRNEVTSIYE